MSAGLCDLPNELVCAIISFIDAYDTLCSLARVSHRYQDFAEAGIYRNVLIRKSTDAYTLRKALQKRPLRATLIQSVNLRPVWYHRRKGLGYHMRYLLVRCKNLREFAVESPTCDFGRAGSEDLWVQDEQKVLAGLKSNSSCRLNKATLHLDGHGDRHWDPNAMGGAYHSWAAVMALPTLTELTVSCAVIHDNIGVDMEPKSSSLKVLELIECNVTLEGLRKILAGPKALQKLHLGENAYHGGRGYNLVPNQAYNSLFAFDPDNFIRALALQSRSLKNFEYIAAPQQHTTKCPTESFSDFVCLEEVQLSEFVRGDRRDHLLATVPNLRRLSIGLSVTKILGAIFELEEHDMSFRELKTEDFFTEEVEKQLATKLPNLLFQEPSKPALSTLQELRLMLPLPPPPLFGSRKAWIKMLGKYWELRGVSLSIFFKDRSSINPPVLYDETHRTPGDIELYSTKSGFTSAATRPSFHEFGDFNLDFGYDGPDVIEHFDFDAFLQNSDMNFSDFFLSLG